MSYTPNKRTLKITGWGALISFFLFVYTLVRLIQVAYNNDHFGKQFVLLVLSIIVLSGFCGIFMAELTGDLPPGGRLHR